MRRLPVLILYGFLAIMGLSFLFTHSALAATNIYYSVGQSTSTTLMTGTPTLTIASGTGTFSTAQTGNIGVGDQVTYGSSTTYISGKVSQTQWTLETATGTTPANITNATVTSINRAFASLAGAISGLTGANYLATSSLVGANVILNLPCYYDTGPDITPVSIPSSTITGPSNYINIFTPNNTSTQVNFSQRDSGTWANTAYSLAASSTSFGYAIRIVNGYVQVTGLQLSLSSTQGTREVISMDSVAGSGGSILLNSNIINDNNAVGINANGPPASPAVTIVNNIIYNSSAATSTKGIFVASGTYYIYDNTISYSSNAIGWGNGGVTTTLSLKNNIVQNDVHGFVAGGGTNILDSSSTNNISDHGDAPGLNPVNSSTVTFISTSTDDFLLSPFDIVARGGGANLTSDPNYAFNVDILGDARPSSGAWDAGAYQYTSGDVTPPTISSFTIPTSSVTTLIPITSFSANDNVAVADYLVTQTSSTPSRANVNWSATPPSSFLYSGQNGAVMLYAWAMDTSGNISSSTSQTVTINVPATNIYYSVGQSTSTNLMTGTPTLTIASGTGTFSTAQTGNIGVGDQVTYGSSTAYISGKISQTQWALETATGTTPANVTNATVTSIKRAFASLNAAFAGSLNSSHINNANLITANVVLNIPCYYDTGEDSVSSTLNVGYTTGPNNYINIFTPNNTSTQANFTQRHIGKWTSNAYAIEFTNGSYLLDIRTNYVRIIGLQFDVDVNVTSSGVFDAIRIGSLTGSGGYIVLDSNIIRGVVSSTGSENLTGIDNSGSSANPTIAAINNIVYGMNGGANGYGIKDSSGNGYIYDNTVYGAYVGYSVTSSVALINDIGQGAGYYEFSSAGASSTNNVSDLSDAPGSSAQDNQKVAFVNAAGNDFHLSIVDYSAKGQGANLSNDPNYAFSFDVDGQSRPSSGAWDVGADEWTAAGAAAPTITSFTMPATASSVIVPVASFIATSTANPIAAWLITGSSATPSSSSPSWATSAPTSFVFNASGTQTAYAWAMDVYGNISSAASQTVIISPTFAAVGATSSLSQSFFSLDTNHYLNSNGTVATATPEDWPTVPFGGTRLWDNYVSWEEINTASGTYNWTGLDNWLAAAYASGSDVLYTFGRTPPWASSNPSQECGYGYGCAAPPSDVSTGDNIWKSFVTALVQQSLASPTAHIKYYELWNEPDCTTNCTWTGTDAQLVTMASDAYNIIHTLDPNAIVLGPSPHSSAAATWLQGYYAAGGAPYQDAVAFHSYDGSNPQNTYNVVSQIKAVMNQYGVGNEQIYDTEGGVFGLTLTSDQQSAFLAQTYLYLFAQNVQRFYWYTWDSSLWNASSGVMKEPGITYANIQPWLVGSSNPSNPCYQGVDDTWYCSLTLANGDPAQVLWNPIQTVTKTVSQAFTTYETVNTSTVGTDPSNAIVANSVEVGNMPILVFENSPSTGISTSITSPANGATVSSTITIAATATSTGGISSVQFYLDGSPFGSAVTSSPYTISWNTASSTSGSHSLYALATDDYSNVATSTAITVTVVQRPIILAIATGTPLTTAATITWTTNQAADSLVEYGTSTNYNASSTYNASYVSSHSVTLTTLNSLTTYHFRVDSSDGILATSTDQTFTTASAGVPSASNVSASGTMIIGHTLTGTYTFSDPNGKPESGSTYEWLRSSSPGGTYTPISGATSDTYTLASADIGQYLRFQVTPVSLSGTGSPAESTATSQINSSGTPTATSVSINGSSTEGQTLTGSYTYSQTDGVAQGTSLYQWLESPTASGTYTPVASATGDTYALGPSDVGQYLEFVVTPVAVYPPATGTPVTSAHTNAIAPSSLPIASNVTISGTPVIAQTLTGSYTYSDSGGHAEASSTYQWFEATSSNGTYTAISLATSTTDTVGSSTVGDYLKFQVSPVSTVATGTPVQSNATTQIQNSGPPIATSVTISGSSTEGQTLTGSYTYSDPNSFAEASSTFHWLEATTTNGTYASIIGATAKTYTLLSSDVGKYLEFRVTPISSVPPTTGSSTFSAPTAAVAPSSYPVASSLSISGSPVVGQVLTGSYVYSDTGGHAEASSTYAWLEASTATGTYSPISSATQISYTLQNQDAGTYLKFEVTPQSTVATGSSTVSGPTSEIASGAVIISSLSAGSITTNSAVISWTTNIAADSTVEYGTSASYGSTGPYGAALVTSHSVTLSGLTPSTLYHFDATSAVTSSSTSSGDNTFTTTGVTSGGGGGGGVSYGGGGGGYYPVTTTGSTSTASTTNTNSSTTTTTTGISLPTTTTGLQAMLVSLEAEFNTLLQQASSQGITIPGITSSSTSYVFTRNLTIGSTGPDVKALQQYLNTHGFSVATTPDYAGSLGYETTYFGTATQKALASFQASVGITPAVGYFGPKTRAYLNGGAVSSPAVPTGTAEAPVVTTSLSLWSQGSAVTMLQNILVKDGYLQGSSFTSGTFDSLTLRAVETFQCAQTIACSDATPGYGIVGPKTRAALGM